MFFILKNVNIVDKLYFMEWVGFAMYEILLINGVVSSSFLYRIHIMFYKLFCTFIPSEWFIWLGLVLINLSQRTLIVFSTVYRIRTQYICDWLAKYSINPLSLVHRRLMFKNKFALPWHFSWNSYLDKHPKMKRV